MFSARLAREFISTSASTPAVKITADEARALIRRRYAHFILMVIALTAIVNVISVPERAFDSSVGLVVSILFMATFVTQSYLRSPKLIHIATTLLMFIVSVVISKALESILENSAKADFSSAIGFQSPIALLLYSVILSTVPVRRAKAQYAIAGVLVVAMHVITNYQAGSGPLVDLRKDTLITALLLGLALMVERFDQRRWFAVVDTSNASSAQIEKVLAARILGFTLILTITGLSPFFVFLFELLT